MFGFFKKKSLAEKQAEVEKQIKTESAKYRAGSEKRMQEKNLAYKKQVLENIKNMNRKNSVSGKLMGAVKKSPEYAGKAVGGVVKVAGGIGKAANAVGSGVNQAFDSQKTGSQINIPFGAQEKTAMPKRRKRKKMHSTQPKPAKQLINIPKW